MGRCVKAGGCAGVASIPVSCGYTRCCSRAFNASRRGSAAHLPPRLPPRSGPGAAARGVPLPPASPCPRTEQRWTVAEGRGRCLRPARTPNPGRCSPPFLWSAATATGRQGSPPTPQRRVCRTARGCAWGGEGAGKGAVPNARGGSWMASDAQRARAMAGGDRDIVRLRNCRRTRSVRSQACGPAQHLPPPRLLFLPPAPSRRIPTAVKRLAGAADGRTWSSPTLFYPPAPRRTDLSPGRRGAPTATHERRDRQGVLVAAAPHTSRRTHGRAQWHSSSDASAAAGAGGFFWVPVTRNGARLAGGRARACRLTTTRGWREWSCG